MTRETKIGLLVGLAFIIMIGVLLSEHVSSTNAPPHSLVEVANNVRNGNGLPAPAPNTPITLTASNNPAPSGPVPTPNELTPTNPGSAIVKVNGPAGQQPLIIEQARDNNTTFTPVNDTNNNSGPIVALNHQNDTDIKFANDLNAGNHPNTTQPASSQKPAVATRDYKAESGDSLSKIATKMYGKNTKALRDGIAAANASLKSNPDKIVVGHTYQIPLLNQPTAASNSNTTLVSNLASPTTRPAQVAQATRTYTAKENDTLWKIAATQLGNGANWQQIADLNRDMLKGGTNIKAGMTLKLPANKTLAMAR